ncbi:MAG: hypothetical protein PUI29_04580 [Aeromonadales bacterium]|nr:hypothetical protein [Aeromonadales bacterium]MDY2890237.1 hypothetical protein [Succinivibrio sp.]
MASPQKGALFVSVAGRNLRRQLIMEDFDRDAEGWYYDLQSRIIRVKRQKPKSDRFSIIVSTEKFDPICMAGAPGGNEG